jgi:hypothetical protein
MHTLKCIVTPEVKDSPRLKFTVPLQAAAAWIVSMRGEKNTTVDKELPSPFLPQVHDRGNRHLTEESRVDGRLEALCVSQHLSYH